MNLISDGLERWVGIQSKGTKVCIVRITKTRGTTPNNVGCSKITWSNLSELGILGITWSARGGTIEQTLGSEELPFLPPPPPSGSLRLFV